MKKRLLSTLPALLMCVSLLSTLTAPAYAHDEGRPGKANIISAGTYYSGLVDANGSLWMWGRGTSGELGTGHSCEDYSDDWLNYMETAPVKVLDDVVSVSVCDYFDDTKAFTAAIRTDGSLWVWGTGEYGQLGTGNNMETTPVKVLDDVIAVDCGRYCTAAIKTDGSLWMWGWLFSDEGRTGQATPVKVMDDVAAVSCGANIVAAIKTDGSLWTWGAVFSSEEIVGYQATPAKVMDDVTSVSCGRDHIAAIQTDGSLWTWGTNNYDQLGAKTVAKIQSTPIKLMDGAASVSCGFYSTAVIKTDGSLWTWGLLNAVGQVGNGEYGNGLSQETPVKVLDDVSAVSCGSYHVLAVKTDGTVWTWGWNFGATDYELMTVLSTPVQIMSDIQMSVAAPAGDPSDAPGASQAPSTSQAPDASQAPDSAGTSGDTSSIVPVVAVTAVAAAGGGAGLALVLTRLKRK